MNKKPFPTPAPALYSARRKNFPGLSYPKGNSAGRNVAPAREPVNKGFSTRAADRFCLPLLDRGAVNAVNGVNFLSLMVATVATALRSNDYKPPIS